MNVSCMTCGAKYAIPEDRIPPGAGALRVRCARCRAVLHVGAPGAPRTSGALSARGGTTDPPAVLSSSGVYRPRTGVGRAVTGLFGAHDDGTGEPRPWYVALGGRSRGPFSASEMAVLAEKGRLRANTLVWRPGFSGWRAVADGEHAAEPDLRRLWEGVRDRLDRERVARGESSSAAPTPLPAADAREPSRLSMRWSAASLAAALALVLGAGLAAALIAPGSAFSP